MNYLKARQLFIFLIVVSVFFSFSDVQAAFWFSKKDDAKKTEAKSAALKAPIKTQTQTLKTAPKPVAAPVIVIKRTSEETKVFSEEMFRERGEFEKKIVGIPIGPRTQLQLDLNKEIEATRRKAETEINSMSKDEKELLRKEYSDKIRQLQSEMDKKLKEMPATRKELKRKEYQDQLNKRREEVAQQIKKMPLDPRDQERLDFEARVAKKTKEFYQR